MYLPAAHLVRPLLPVHNHIDLDDLIKSCETEIISCLKIVPCEFLNGTNRCDNKLVNIICLHDLFYVILYLIVLQIFWNNRVKNLHITLLILTVKYSR